jgi:hypothetical protein
MALGNTGMYGRYTPRVDDREYSDLLGGQSMMGGDAASQAIIEELLQGGGGQYSPGGIEMPPMFPEQMDPQDFINMQLAGEVLPMRAHPPTESSVNMRLQTPGVGARSQGMQSIQNLGGPKSPYLDLMDVLMGRFPGPGGR